MDGGSQANGTVYVSGFHLECHWIWRPPLLIVIVLIFIWLMVEYFILHVQPLYENSRTRPKRCINPAAGPLLALLNEKEQEHCNSPTKWCLVGYWCACFWPNKKTLGVVRVLTSGTYAHSQAMSSSTSICLTIPEFAGPPLVPHSLKFCCLQCHPVWWIWRWVSGAGGRHIPGGLHKPPCHSPAGAWM